MRIVTAALALMMTTSAQAAVLTDGIPRDGLTMIRMSGPILPSDATDFKEVADHIPGHVTVVLSGPGGNTDAALQIGNIIRERKWDTTVPPDSRCDSGCALIWLGGVDRSMDVSSQVGFHAAYDAFDKYASVNGPATARVGAYMARLGYPDQAVVFATSALPQELQSLTADMSSTSPGAEKRIGIPFDVKWGDYSRAPLPSRLAKQIDAPILDRLHLPRAVCHGDSLLGWTCNLASNSHAG